MNTGSKAVVDQRSQLLLVSKFSLGIIRDPDANAVVFRRYQNELRDTVFGQFEWSASKMGIAHLFKFQVSPMQIIYIPTGQNGLYSGQQTILKSSSQSTLVKAI
jgi:phage terminase large subunit